ncbi:v-type atp synthase subunit i [hydrocarbon metagenome]|uniref:V-type atp synthase subunit i n=1 Tax=hydrocarbon metagenome TaxID=938273 RepID=A0A0W8FH58_9ZZZZ
MSHLLIAASRDQMETIIRELYSHNVFHIKVFTEKEDEEHEGLTIGPPLSGAGEASSRLIQIRSLEGMFGVDRESLEPEQRRQASALKALIDRDLPVIWEQIEGLLARRAACDAALKEHEQQIRELAPFAMAPIELDLYRGYENIAVFTGRIPRDVEIPAPHEKFFSASKEGTFIAVFVPVAYRDDVERCLLDAHFAALPVPMGEGHPKDLIAEHTSRISFIREEIERLDAKIEEIKKQQTEFIVACEELLTAEVEQAEAPLRFATTQQAFIAEGWVPTTEVDRIKSRLSLSTGGRALVTEIEEPGDQHHAPVEYDNPSFAQPTELIIDTYSRPRYDELDPTIMVSIIFPLFFGIILGDIGYGLILLGFALGLRRVLKGEAIQNLLGVLRNASIFSIIFGVLYAEFFGCHPGATDFALWHPIVSRHLEIGTFAQGHQADIILLLVIAVWIGILQITLGRILNAVNHAQHREMVGVMAQLGWIAMMYGILTIIWSIAPIPLMPDLTGAPALVMGLNVATLAGALLLVFGAVAIMRESALELIEIPTIISHAMSYTRLSAVGLSSVAIAMVVNLIAIEMLIAPQLEHLTAVGIVFIILGILVLLVGHLLNTALGLLGGGLQSLRLQYVEFFTKFYKGGGERYNPFGMRKKFTED